jgi:hypothetical protein
MYGSFRMKTIVGSLFTTLSVLAAMIFNNYFIGPLLAGSLLDSPLEHTTNRLSSKIQSNRINQNSIFVQACAREFDRCNDIVRCCDPNSYYCVRTPGNFAYGYCIRAYNMSEQ